MRFLDHEPNVVDAVNVFLIVHDDLDQRRAVVNVFADGLEHFVVRVGERVFRRRQIAFFRLQMKLPAVRRDDAPGIHHGRTRHQAALDGFAQRRVGIVAGVADVAHRREARRQHVARIRNALDGAVRSRIAAAS